MPPGDRYRWMNYNAAMEALFRESFSRAVAWFEAALREPLVDWRAHGYFAEALLCVDRPAEARRQMKLALAAAPENERAQVFAWWGSSSCGSAATRARSS
ncbi:MAG: hypothetical protein M0D55_04695 [Elusimicrobiota bacterium]|nr:MAG: hypothetical protein M0D55_04695 [Elusimicrobiota bacterium]